MAFCSLPQPITITKCKFEFGVYFLYVIIFFFGQISRNLHEVHTIFVLYKFICINSCINYNNVTIVPWLWLRLRHWLELCITFLVAEEFPLFFHHRSIYLSEWVSACWKIPMSFDFRFYLTIEWNDSSEANATQREKERAESKWTEEKKIGTQSQAEGTFGIYSFICVYVCAIFFS